ncbi:MULTISPECIES: NAD(P)H-dependent oxidoreductase subunit E [Parvimonas]|uniref:NAD(P)H-dependent oxidoreductase subunit E n=1 Tax=Parvimonas parva TaxID=2769485 RepID=A0ABS1CAM0_9FIRM|nr:MULTISPECIES: NAD(P)H-dependent oxidoreductase subunit E [Parvimonas]MBK1468934.1 NAD(P)H-dependent oxidoreductase subunit E [Parvimonas parva]
MAFVFNVEENQDKINELCEFIDKKKDIPGALMPVLQEAQSIFGYLPEEIMDLIAKRMKIFPAKVFGVATFYSQFSFIPKGKYQVSVCMGTACYVKGAQEILDEFCDRIGVAVGGTSEDLKFSVAQTRCIGECNLAPVVTINEDVYAYIKKADIRRIMRKYK